MADIKRAIAQLEYHNSYSAEARCYADVSPGEHIHADKAKAWDVRRKSEVSDFGENHTRAKLGLDCLSQS